MPEMLAPGVYVQEVPSGSRPIEAVGTSTAGFVGIAPNPDARKNEAVAVNNWSQFSREFVPKDAKSTPLSQAVYGFFLNGGSRCYVVNVGSGGTISGGGTGPRTGIDVLEEVDEVAVVAIPGYTDAASYEAALSHCEKLKDRVAILDAPVKVDAITQLTTVATASARKPTGGGGGAGGKAPSDAPAAGGGGGLRARNSDFGAYYFPWISVRDPLSGDIVDVAPSGHLAGIYARVDTTRGVHKAPANEPVRGALDVAWNVTQEDQGVLNPQGINCIRLFPTEGIRVWGARTVAASSSDWRYLNVRRLFNMIEKSIGRSTRWVVFEPNDMALWKAIKRDVSAFLTLLWRQGALMGATPEEAFFVQCDAETNPPEVIDAGQVVTMIGIAPVKPAEFVVFRIGQGVGGAEVETQGTTKG